jgi:hypothetical protein
VISFKDCWPHDPDMFELKVYTQWLYNGRLDHFPVTNGIYQDLAYLYVFGEQILDAVFCNAVMDVFTRMHGRQRYLPLGNIITMVYDQTKKGSKLREVVADMYAYRAVENGLGMKEFAEEMPKEFLVDVVVKMAGVREKKDEEWWVRLMEEGYYMV